MTDGEARPEKGSEAAPEAWCREERAAVLARPDLHPSQIFWPQILNDDLLMNHH